MAKIAIVEDEADLRADLVEYLSARGHEAIGCEDGRALDRASHGCRFDVAILDINLPGEDGLSIARRLRGDKSLGIIMLTARNNPAEGRNVGADAYLTKPADFGEVEARVRALSERRRMA